jgi:hypothetical protein
MAGPLLPVPLRCGHDIAVLETGRADNPVACLGKPDPADMKVYCPTGKETFDDDETTEEAPLCANDR